MVLLLAVLLASVGCASGHSVVSPGFDFGSIKRVAVVDVQGDLPSKGARNAIGDYFAMELMMRGYQVVDRSQVDAILAEQDFQRSAVASDEDVARAGQILNVDAAIVVTVAEFGQRITLTAKMVGVEQGRMLWMGEGSASTGKLLGTVAGAALGGAAGATIGGDSAGRTVAGVAGAALGGVAGYSLTPGELKATRKAIKKVCENVPSVAGAR